MLVVGGKCPGDAVANMNPKLIRQKGPKLLSLIFTLRARESLLILSYGGFLVAQAAARRMLPKGQGTILLTGASASVKGYPQSAVFAMIGPACSCWNFRFSIPRAASSNSGLAASSFPAAR